MTLTAIIFYQSQIVVFTRAVTRAVQLEVVPNLTASSFICALKRFISRRGLLNLLISDVLRMKKCVLVKN